MIELIVVVLMSQQCEKFTYSAYGFSSIGSWLYSNQAYTPGILLEAYKILGLPILMTVRSLAVSFEKYNRGSLSSFTTRVD